MKTLKLGTGIYSLLKGGIAAAALMLSSFANAHTVQVCWQDVGAVTTFYAGTYHTVNPSNPIGNIIIDGFSYPFSGAIARTDLPVNAHCWAAPNYPGAPSGNPDGVANPNVRWFQTFTLAIEAGTHTLDFSQSTAVEWPITTFPPQTFGGGACADADFDGICNDDDACPLDFSNDADGDGICGNIDNCPLDSNPFQTDANGNGQGDACEGNVCGNSLVTGSEQCDDGNVAGGDGCSAICTIELADSPPNANAGSDQAVNEGQVVALDGSASNDPDGDPLVYAWTQNGGTSVVLSGGNTSTPTFTAPTVAIGGETLSFLLTVTANEASDTDTVSIGVVNINHPPVADAGNDLSIAEGSPVGLNGGDSFDVDSDPFSYSWVQIGGSPTVALNDANTATPNFTAPYVAAGGAPGIVATLVFELTVDDSYPCDAPASGYTCSDIKDTVTVEVTNVNNAPNADAGFDKTLNENSALQLNGNASSDPDGDVLTYAWTQIGGTPVTLIGATTATPSLTTPFVSTGGEDLTFDLTVDDGYGGSNNDVMVIHVQNANDPPNASLAQPSRECLWPPNHKYVAISINGVSDPEDNATITIDSIWQDEVTNGLGDGDTAVDAVINSDGTVLLRAERSGKGDGRVYHISFTASDLEGSDSGVVEVCVPHNKKSTAIDGGEIYDSTY